MWVAKQSDESARKVFVEGHCPERTTIAMNDNRLAFHHTFQYLPTTFQSVKTYGYASFAIGVTWANDGYWKSFFAVVFHQQFFARNFVARVFPMRIAKRGAFVDDVVACWLGIGRCRTDVNVLACAAGKESVVAFNLLRHKTNEFAYSIEHCVTNLT